MLCATQNLCDQTIVSLTYRNQKVACWLLGQDKLVEYLMALIKGKEKV